ncbi:MAG: nicotinamide-nucleotide amidohydrolase family protein [Syntrophobacterales bacterium]|jgi:nicotinamide-nucleotide amidase|nr:nicotinamide-nucleotide amidohydrolase family protein [Syntrophobacterales bacterium]
MTVEEIVGSLLREKGMTIALAESCTGGLTAKRVTDVAGASDYFGMGFVTYGNIAKERFLAVPENMLATRGAVSREVAGAMAEGVRIAAGADIGVSITGIAGPGGGSPAKPVGTVYIGVSMKDGLVVRKYLFHGDRAAIREATSEEALTLTFRCLNGEIV